MSRGGPGCIRVTRWVLCGTAEVELALEALVMQCQMQMRQRPLPPLYEAGVVYREEDPGVEDWQSATETLERGYGDCEDLVAYRVAELRETGEDPRARGIVRRVRPGLQHALVRRGSGRIEDPSRKLGM